MALDEYDSHHTMSFSDSLSEIRKRERETKQDLTSMKKSLFKQRLSSSNKPDLALALFLIDPTIKDDDLTEWILPVLQEDDRAVQALSFFVNRHHLRSPLFFSRLNLLFPAFELYYHRHGDVPFLDMWARSLGALNPKWFDFIIGYLQHLKTRPVVLWPY